MTFGTDQDPRFPGTEPTAQPLDAPWRRHDGALSPDLIALQRGNR